MPRTPAARVSAPGLIFRRASTYASSDSAASHSFGHGSKRLHRFSVGIGAERTLDRFLHYDDGEYAPRKSPAVPRCDFCSEGWSCGEPLAS